MNLSTSIIPQGDRIAVLLTPPAKTTKSGIVLPDSPDKKNPRLEGTIIAISEWLNHVWTKDIADRPLVGGFIPPEVKVGGFVVGDIVLFGQYSGDDVATKDLDTGDDITVKILPVEQVLGLVEKVQDITPIDEIPTPPDETPSTSV